MIRSSNLGGLKVDQAGVRAREQLDIAKHKDTNTWTMSEGEDVG